MFEDVETAIAPGRRRRLCGFTRWVYTLPERDQGKAVELAFDEAYTCAELADYFRSKGAPFNYQVLNRHRNRRCCRGL